ncbi:MAG: RNA methyltransferase [Burkholderiales bacterium]
MSDALKNIRIVLCDTRHPGNIGSAARAMKTMGLTQLVLVNPHLFPDKQADWLATNAVDVLEQATVCADLDSALSGVVLAVACTARSREIAVPAVTARDAAARMIEVARSQPVALVFGSEVRGLTTDQVKRCQMVATILTDASHTSLNLAAAVQVFAYELRLHAVEQAITPSGSRPRKLAAYDEVELFYAHLERELMACGFLNPVQPKRFMQRVRRMFARMQLEHEEVKILRGVVRTLRTPKKRR